MCKVQLRVESDEFDTFVELVGPDGTALSSNDDGPTGTNALIEGLALPQDGNYRVLVRAIGNKGGPYTVTATVDRPAAPAETRAPVLNPGQIEFLDPSVHSLSEAAAPRPNGSSVLQEVARLGRGEPIEIIWGAGDETLAVRTVTGIWFYDATDFTQQPRFVPSAEGLTVSPDLRLMAFVSEGSIVVTDAQSQAVVQTIEYPSDSPPTRLEFDPTGRLLVVTDETTGFRIWDIREGAVVADADQSQADLISGRNITFSPDGTQVLYVDAQGSLQYREVRSGLESVFTFTASRAVHSTLGVIFGFDPDGETVFYSNGISMQRVDPDDLSEITRLPWPASLRSGHIYGYAFSSDNSALAVGFTDGAYPHQVELWDAAASGAIYTFEAALDTQDNMMLFAPDGRHLLIPAPSGNLQLWSTGRGSKPQLSAELLSTAASGLRWLGLRSATFSHDSAQIAAYDARGAVRIWDVETGSERIALEGFYKTDPSLAIDRAHNGIALIEAGYFLSYLLIESESVQFAHLPDQYAGSEVSSSLVSPDGRVLAIAKDTGTILLWDMQNNTLLSAVDEEYQSAESVYLTFSRSGARIASLALGVSGAETPSIRILDASTGNHLASFDFEALAIGFRNDEELLAVGYDGSVRAYNTDTGDVEDLFVVQPPEAAAFSEDCEYLALLMHTLSSETSQLSLLRLENPGQQWSSSPFLWSVRYSLVFSPDNSYLVLGDWENSLYVWDVRSGEEVGRNTALPAGVDDVDISPDGGLIITTGLDRIVRFWRVPS